MSGTVAALNLEPVRIEPEKGKLSASERFQEAVIAKLELVRRVRSAPELVVGFRECRAHPVGHAALGATPQKLIRHGYLLRRLVIGILLLVVSSNRDKIYKGMQQRKHQQKERTAVVAPGARLSGGHTPHYINFTSESTP